MHVPADPSQSCSRLRSRSHLSVSLLNIEPQLLLQPHDLESLKVCQVTPFVLLFPLLRPA